MPERRSAARIWPARKLATFSRDEDGSLIIFGLFMMAAMLLATGIAYDVMRTEVARTKLQNTLDRAVLAAADLDQTLPPKTVVEDYFTKAGLAEFIVDINLEEGLNYRTVSAETEAIIGTQFMQMVGIETLTAPATGTANETITDVEISLVLDNSGSMASNNRLNLLKQAASDFIDIVVPAASAEKKVSINIIPFATQVNAGPDLLQYYNVTNEHDYSDCVNFSSGDFTQASLSTSDTLQRTGHFDVQSWSKPLRDEYLTCSTSENRRITVMGHNRAQLKAKINAMWAQGNTSIDVGTKWGLALLDPSARGVVSSMISADDVHDDFDGRPYDYTEPQVLKVLVVMSDGENTSQYMLRDQYRSGNSPFFVDKYNTSRESYYHNNYGTSYDYYYDNGNQWRTEPYYNWSRAQRLSWPEVWASRSVAHFARYTVAEVLSLNWNSLFDDYYTYVSPNTKNTRTSQICQAAKDQGITVYTIGMDTYGQGDATLSDCATSPAYFFDVDRMEIGQAFSSIARDINRLRLTH